MSQYQDRTAPAARPADGLAIASLVCGILGLLGICGYGFGVLPAIAGLICGLMSKTNGGVRTAGIVCSSIAIGLCIIVIILVFVVGIALFGAAAAAGHPQPVTSP